MSDSIEKEAEQRVTYLDVCEQQLEASIMQAQATISSCTAALTTVRLLRSQLVAAKKIADERRQQQGETVKAPATFGKRRREAASNGDAEEREE